MLKRPAAYFVRADAVDATARALEEALGLDGLSLLDEDDDEALATRTIHMAQVTADWIGVWDSAAHPHEGWPDGDPATSLARGLSATGDTDVIYLWGIARLWGYFLYRRGLAVDQFASDAHILAAEVELEEADVDGRYRGDLARLLPFAGPDVTEEDLASALTSGDEALYAFLHLIGLPTGVALSMDALAPAERELTLRMLFAPRP